MSCGKECSRQLNVVTDKRSFVTGVRPPWRDCVAYNRTAVSKGRRDKAFRLSDFGALNDRIDGDAMHLTPNLVGDCAPQIELTVPNVGFLECVTSIAGPNGDAQLYER